MSILSPDYDRLTNSDIGGATLTQQYKTTFASGDIDGAHTLVEDTNPNVAMSATRLNDLCDTITYMQNIWKKDKAVFFNYLRATTGFNMLKNPILVTEGSIVDTLPTFGLCINGSKETTHDRWQFAEVDFNIILSSGKYTFGFIEMSGEISDIQLQLELNGQIVASITPQQETIVDIDSTPLYWRLNVGFKTNTQYDNVIIFPTLKPELSTRCEHSGSLVYAKGDLVWYDGAPYICIENGITGEFDPSKWILLQPNDLGVNLMGEYDSQQTYQVNDVVWQYDTINDTIIWKVCTSSPQTFERIATKYPNIRYLGSNDTPYTNEIYMTDWNGGEA